MVICLEQGADLHTAQLIPLPLIVSCFSKMQVGFTFLVLAHPGSPGQRAVKWLCVILLMKLRFKCFIINATGARWYIFSSCCSSLHILFV